MEGVALNVAWLGGSPGTSEQLGQQATTEFASDETVDASQMVRETFKQELKDLGVSQETDASKKCDVISVVAMVTSLCDLHPFQAAKV